MHEMAVEGVSIRLSHEGTLGMTLCLLIILDHIICLGNAPHSTDSSRTDTFPSSSSQCIVFIDNIDIEDLSLGCLTCALLCDKSAGILKESISINE